MTESTEPFEHWCVACGKTEMLTSEEAYRKGVGLPTSHGAVGSHKPAYLPDVSDEPYRLVGRAVAMDGYDAKQLSPEQREIAARIVAEGPDGSGHAD